MLGFDTNLKLLADYGWCLRNFENLEIHGAANTLSN